MEPLLAGIVPVIGPHWDNFHWVGNELAQRGLVSIAANAETATAALIKALNAPVSPEKVRQEISTYVRTRQGGTHQACNLIARYLSSKRET